MPPQERELYLNLCETHKVPVDQNVLKAFGSTSPTNLDLSGLSLTKETCELLANLLLSSTAILELNFTDCLLPPRGLAALLKSLSHVACLTSLNLKGNNISGSCIAKLGQMISNNTSIKKLNLEWNSLGLFPDSFKEFCVGLAKNACIEELDLQNNRLTPDCASMLSNALSANATLKCLDIRWNDIGWQGGQYIYEALQNNSAINSVQLQGNRIPGDLIQSIDQCASHNLSRHQVVQECSMRNHLLAKHVRRIEAKRTLEIESLAKQNEEIIKETEIRLNSVEEVLNMKNVALANAQVEIKRLHGELRKLEHTYDELKKQFEDEEETKKIVAEKHQNELEKMKKKFADDLEQLSEQLAHADNQLSSEKGKVTEFKKKLMLAEDEVQRLKENQSNLIDIERKHQKEEIDSLIREYEGKFERAQKEFEEKIGAVKSDAQRSHQRFTERISSLESTIYDLERKLAEQSSQAAHMSQELARSAETTALAVQEAKAKELTRIQALEENLEAARDARLRAEKQLENLQRNMSHLQEQNANLVAELGEPQRKLALLHEELSREREVVSRLRSEKNEEVARGDARKAEIDRLQLEMNALTRQIGELKTVHSVREQKLIEEQDKLQMELQQKGKEIQRMRSDEVERAAALYSAFTKYLGNIQPSVGSFITGNIK